MMRLLIIALGGGLGAVLRVIITAFLPKVLFGIPLTVLIINIIGSFCIGIVTEAMALFWHASLNIRHFLIQGLLGGFTTFSAFSLEFGLLYERGWVLQSIFYTLLMCVLSFICFFGGLRLVRLFV
jgi:fluoride exporter